MRAAVAGTRSCGWVVGCEVLWETEGMVQVNVLTTVREYGRCLDGLCGTSTSTCELNTINPAHLAPCLPFALCIRLPKF